MLEDENLSHNDEVEELINNDEQQENEKLKSSISADLIRGHINTIILRSLSERDKYGYEIINEIDKKSHGQYELKQPTLYSALKRLETQGYVKSYWKSDETSSGGRRKYFTLTESGKEITEHNRAEWEYSRTVIDSLISDQSFDFNNPPPSALDLNILKQTTTRVPAVRAAEPIEQSAQDNLTASVQAPAEQQPDTLQQTTQQVVDPVAESEQQRKLHENYLRLVSQPAAPLNPQENVMPNGENIDTQKLLYINRPATERDYRNLIDDMYNRTIHTSSAPTKQIPQEQAQPINNVVNATPIGLDVQNKANADGLKIYPSTNQAQSTGKYSKPFNVGKNLFKCSVISSIYILLIFILTIVFKNSLQVNNVYCFTILGVAIINVAIFGAMAFIGFGKNSVKPTTHGYLSVCIITCILAILIVCVISLLLNINFAVLSDVLSKIIIPSSVILALPLFAFTYYMLSK